MKGLKKLALATAVAAAPFAVQAGGLQPMTDSQMGDVTGQAGVTIELETEVRVGQFSYNQGNSGSFLVDGIRIGGWEDGDTLDLTIDIDLQDNGDALISLGGYHAGTPVLLGFDMDRMGLEGADGAQATLMSNFEMDMGLSMLNITASTAALNADGTVGDRTSEAGHIAIDVGFVIQNLDMDFDVAAVGIRGLSMAGAGTMDVLRAGGAITQVADNPAVLNMTIAPGAPLATYAGLDQPDEALVIRVDNFIADMYIADMRIGRDGDEIGANRSIGSMGMAGLEINNTRLAIYGRE